MVDMDVMVVAHLAAKIQLKETAVLNMARYIAKNIVAKVELQAHVKFTSSYVIGVKEPISIGSKSR